MARVHVPKAEGGAFRLLVRIWRRHDHSMTTSRFIVSGIVQDVFFRAATQMRARKLGLTGFARNRADGRVEVVASGTDEALRELETWLHAGPPAARVDAIEREDLAPQEHSDFARL